MNFTSLKRKTAAQFCEKALNKLKKAPKNSPKEIKSIGVLATSRLFGSYDISRNLSQKLGIHSKNFEILIYENLKDEFVTQHYNTFSEKDVGMFGKIKSQNALGFIETPFDLLINYCGHDSVYTDVVALRSKAAFKASFANDSWQDLYSFMIDVEGNKIDIFNDELGKYLRILALI